MSRDNEFIHEDLIDLGDVTVETKGVGPGFTDDPIPRSTPGIADD